MFIFVKQFKRKMQSKNDEIIEKCKKLAVYENLSFIQKKMFNKSENIKNLLHHLNVIKNTSYEHWEKNFKTNYINHLIIKNLKNE